jgi:GT2 family glycosyltransferase
VENKSEPVIDILVPAYNHIELTIPCLDSIYAHTQNPFHLILIDNGSTDNLTPAYMTQFAKDHDNVTHIRFDDNGSGNRFFNKGLENCKTSYMATVMNSMRVEPDWEIVALQLMSQNPQIGIIGFKCLFPNNRIESAGIRMYQWLPTDMGRELQGHRLSVVYETDAVQWAFALLRVEAVKGVLEENTFHSHRGWDDIDNCFVLKKRGWKCFYDGLGVGYHYPRSTRGSDTPEAVQQNKENAITFYKRWGFYDDWLKQNPDENPHGPPKGIKTQDVH